VVIGKNLIRNDLEAAGKRNGPDWSGPFTRTIIPGPADLMRHAYVFIYQ
jgi:hypothetical protein